MKMARVVGLMVVIGVTCLAIGVSVGRRLERPTRIDVGWVLLVRPEARLYLDNATADWSDYLGGSLGAFDSAEACMVSGRGQFVGWQQVPAPLADERAGGQSIQCVRACRIDVDAVLLACDDVTQPEGSPQ